MRDFTPSCPEPDFGDGVLILGRQTVLPEWIDYNGHMNVAYYTLAFDKAFDDFLENWMGTGISYVARSRMGPMALQSQICYLGELMEGEAFSVRVWLIDCDEKRMHFFGQMIAENDGRPVDGVLTLQFRATPPFDAQPTGTDRSRQITAVIFLSNQDLEFVRTIEVKSQTNILRARR